MKQLLSILLLVTITATAYAEKNHKATAKSTVLNPKPQQSAQQVDTTKHVQYNERERDPRVGRSMYIAPAQPAKQGK
ncbi:hypothetical protein CJD36_004430 [Flavipsychrobacter stenotrophus]|uniref:Uncharacterized protein n=1 Tax=Flavipsychrobacter stenotrophus TaxID=2077091 RepID=A0A2S7T2K8_9BACT|nr:hypothetical protein [Flavipsychrobacter stenotrophus]PQJ12996.1 hypothetical protein CJD36_004430 [Flavipsychrobacter stenotrophus]